MTANYDRAQYSRCREIILIRAEKCRVGKKRKRRAHHALVGTLHLPWSFLVFEPIIQDLN